MDKFFLLLFCVWVSNTNAEFAIVLRVIDGDTIKVRVRSAPITVRLIGIDAPETTINEKALRDLQNSHDSLERILSLGKKSMLFTKRNVPEGSTVRLEYDRDLYDRYGRTLAYVFLDGGPMLQELLLESGNARPCPIKPNLRYKSYFESLCAKNTFCREAQSSQPKKQRDLKKRSSHRSPQAVG